MPDSFGYSGFLASWNPSRGSYDLRRLLTGDEWETEAKTKQEAMHEIDILTMAWLAGGGDEECEPA